MTSEATPSRPTCILGATALPTGVEKSPSQSSSHIRSFNAASQTIPPQHHTKGHSVSHSEVAWCRPQEGRCTSQHQNASTPRFSTQNMGVVETSSNIGGNGDVALARAEATASTQVTRNTAGKKRFCCPFCPYSSIYTSHVRKHIRIHTKERPFKCNICSRAFSQKENLVKHTRTHASRTRLEC